MTRSAPMLQAAKARTLQPVHTIQAEWENTLGRIKEIAEVIEASQAVSDLHANLTVKRPPHTNVEAIERVLFQNLLPSARTRTVHADSIVFGCDWLPYWRKAVPFAVEKLDPINRLAPWTPRDQWTYRFNVIDADH